MTDMEYDIRTMEYDARRLCRLLNELHARYGDRLMLKASDPYDGWEAAYFRDTPPASFLDTDDARVKIIFNGDQGWEVVVKG